MRKFNYITVGLVLKELNEEIKKFYLEVNPETDEEDIPKISRETFYRLEKRLDLPKVKRTSAKQQWRVYSIKQKEEIKKRIREEFNLI